MPENTVDPDVVVEERTESSVTYRSVSTAKRWVVSGVCNSCGLCAVGAEPLGRYEWPGTVGYPDACIDTAVGGRLDEPVTPGFNQAIEEMRQAFAPDAPGCSLTVSAYL